MAAPKPPSTTTAIRPSNRSSTTTSKPLAGHGSSQRFGIQWERWWLGSVVVASGEDQSLVCVAQTEGLGSEIIGLRRTAIDTGQGALDRAPLGENL